MQLMPFQEDPFKSNLFKSNPFRENQFGRSNKNSYFQSNSISLQTFIDKKGKQHVKKVQKRNFKNIDKDGNVMEDFEELYKDSNNGINQMRKGKRLNKRGMEILKKNKKGNFQEFKQFYNMEEGDVDQFAKDWRAKLGRPTRQKYVKRFFVVFFIIKIHQLILY